MFVYSSDRAALDYEKITVSTTAIGITGSKMKKSGYSPCLEAFISVEAANIRFRLDGTAPTSTEGHLVANGASVTLASESDIRNFLAIRTADTDAILRVTLRY